MSVFWASLLWIFHEGYERKKHFKLSLADAPLRGTFLPRGHRDLVKQPFRRPAVPLHLRGGHLSTARRRFFLCLRCSAMQKINSSKSLRGRSKHILSPSSPSYHFPPALFLFSPSWTSNPADVSNTHTHTHPASRTSIYTSTSAAVNHLHTLSFEGTR